LAEFTGERLIPGEVDIDLLNEHMARYHFAVRLARGKRVLDAGCGAGYGSAELADAAERVTGIDIAQAAVDYARAHYALPNLTFEPASCTQLPYADGAFDLVVAFEVIEHLENWRDFLQEVRRVLAPAGQLIVSTPNRLYYTESRGADGANPFHVHEFDFDEFSRELKQFFPYVTMFLENHVEGVTFQPHEAGDTVEARVDAAEPVPDESHFSSRYARTARRSATRRFYTCRGWRTCCANASAISPSWKASWARRTHGWIKRSWIWRNSTANIRSCSGCSANRRKSWSKATVGRRN
jgi:SAM-dependent methyltransferase